VSLASLALGSLASNGGPTQTIALEPGSVAIDAVACSPNVTTDQRGQPRPDVASESLCDAGAYESAYPPPPPPVYALSITKGVSASEAGPFVPSISVATGSTVWYQITVTNVGNRPVADVTVGDTATSGALPSACPAAPTVLGVGGTYGCTYSATAAAGSTTNRAFVDYMASSVAYAEATVTGTGGSPTPTLSDGIAAGVNKGSSGFGTASVILPGPGYVTYLVRVDPSFAGQHLAIYTEAKGGAWTYTTGRIVAADGSVHYYRKIDAWTGFWAKLDGSSSHGRIAAVR